MGNESPSDFCLARQKLKHAVRQTRFTKNFHQHVRGHGRTLGGLKQHRIAGDERA